MKENTKEHVSSKQEINRPTAVWDASKLNCHRKYQFTWKVWFIFTQERSKNNRRGWKGSKCSRLKKSLHAQVTNCQSWNSIDSILLIKSTNCIITAFLEVDVSILTHGSCVCASKLHSLPSNIYRVTSYTISSIIRKTSSEIGCCNLPFSHLQDTVIVIGEVKW